MADKDFIYYDVLRVYILTNFSFLSCCCVVVVVSISVGYCLGKDD